MEQSPLPVGTVPIYQALVETLNQGEGLVNLTVDKIFEGIEKHVADGVDFITVHCGLTLAALESTLRLYLQPDQLLQKLPIMRMFSVEPEAQKQRCQRLLERLAAEKLPVELTLVKSFARVGGGSMPLVELPDWALQIRPSGESVDRLARRLRSFFPAVIPRVQNDCLMINLRAVTEDEEGLLGQILMAGIRGEV